MKLLLSDKRVDINSCDPETGDTPLHLAVQKNNNNLEVVTILLEGGADVNILNNKGELPIDLATDQKIVSEIFMKSKK